MFGLDSYTEEEAGDSTVFDPRLDPNSDHDLSVQCIEGHVFMAQPGTDLGERLIAREANGSQPTCVQSHECPVCIEEEEVEEVC